MKNITPTEPKLYVPRLETSLVLKPGEKAGTVRNMEKLLKIERLKRESDLTLNTIEIINPTLKLDLINIETCNEPNVTVSVNLGLDQLEESED